MPISKKTINFLEKSGVKYELVEHRKVFTAFDKTATLKVSPKIVGKTLAVKLDKKVALVLIPANRNLDKQKLKKVGKVKSTDFVKENWIKKNLKGVKTGALPPFGSLWKLPTFVDGGLMKEAKIILNSGVNNRSIKITPNNFKKLMPDLIIGNFAKAKN